MMQSTSLQVLPVVSSLTSTSSSGVPSQQLGKVGIAGNVVYLWTLSPFVKLAMSNRLC